MTGFGKIRLNAANNFFQYHRVKPYGSIFFEKIFMAEMDRHQLALAYVKEPCIKLLSIRL